MGKNVEFKRQLFHLMLGIVLVVLLDWEILNLQSMFVLLLIGFVISIISKKKELFGVRWFLKHFDREEEGLPGYGALTFFLGSIIVLGLFRKEVALAAIMVLALGDSFSHLGRFGRVKNPFNSAKFLEGTLLGVVAGTFGASLFVSWQAAFFGSLVAMAIEGLELAMLRKKIDDNLLIPIVAGLVINLF
jgi:dolichol kinase